MLVVADLYRNVIDRITCIDQFADVEVIVIGQVLDSSCRPCTVVHGKGFQFSIAGSRLVHRSLHEEFVPLRSFCRREVRVRGAAVLFYHCTECCGIAGVIVDRNFSILIVADLVGIAVLLIRTADQCTVQNVCVGLGIFALGLSDVAPLVIPCTAGSSVVPCLRVIVTHADHIAKVLGVVAEAVVHDIVSKLGVLFSLGGIVLIQLIDCHICQKCSRGSVAERTPLEQPRQTVRCIGDLLAAVTSRPVFQMLGELVFPLGFAGVDRIQQHAALHHIVPAHAPCVLHFAGLFFLAQVRDIVGLAQIQILLLAGCHVQPVCRIEQVIIECGDLIVRLFLRVIADGTQLVGTVEQVNGVFQIFLCLFRLGVLEVQIAGAECRRHVGLNAAVLTGIVRTLGFALHQFVLVHIHFGRAPPYVVERAVADHIDNVVTLIAAHQIIQCKLEIVLIHGTLASLFHTVAVVQQTPAQQCCGVRIGQCEFQVISGIKPAACHIVVGHAVRTPADFVPVRLFAALLHLVEKHRLLESLSIVVLAVAVSSGHRCRGNCRSHSGHCQHCGRNRRDPLLHRQSILPFQKTLLLLQAKNCPINFIVSYLA